MPAHARNPVPGKKLPDFFPCLTPDLLEIVTELVKKSSVSAENRDLQFGAMK